MSNDPLGKANIEKDAKRLGVLLQGRGIAGQVTGSITPGGEEWSYAGDMYIDANDASPTTLYVLNDGGSTADLDVENDIIVGGTVDGVDIASFSDATFLMVSASGDTANERTISTGDGIDYTDGGAGSTYSIFVDLATTSGLNFSSGELLVGAGDGIDVLTNTIAVDVTDIIGTGLDESANDIIHGTGDFGDLHTNYAEHDQSETISATWTWSDSNGIQFRDSDLYIHSSTDGTLKLAADGYIWLNPAVGGAVHLDEEFQLDADLDFFGGSRSITTASNGIITLTPDGTGHVHIDSDLEMDNNARIYESFTSGYFGSGYALEYNSGTSASYLEIDNVVIRGSLRTNIFQVDTVKASNGYLFISSATEVTEPYGTYLYCKDSVFDVGDLLWYKDVDIDTGTIYDVRMTVTGDHGSTSRNGQTVYYYTVTIDTGSGSNIHAGGTVVRVGSTSDATRRGSLYFEADGTYAPFMDVLDDVSSWATFGSDEKTKVRLGQLEGITSVDEYGIFAGDSGYASDDQYVVVTSSRAIFNNIDVMLQDSTNPTIELNATTPYIAMGYPRPTSYLQSSADGYWAGKDSGTFKSFMGTTDASGNLTAGYSWDGSDLNVIGNLVVGPNNTFSIPGALVHLPFNGPLPYGVDYQLDTTDHHGLTSRVYLSTSETSTYKPTGVRGKFGGKALEVVTEAGSNECTNPSFEVDTSGWYTGGTNTIAQSDFVAYAGSYSLKCDWVDSTQLCYRNVTLDSNTWQGSAWIWVPDSWDGGDIYVDWVNFTSGSETAIRIWDSDTDPTNEWFRIVRQLVPDVGDVSGSFNIYTTSAPSAGGHIYVDAVQIEQRVHCTPYMDGDMPNVDWDGTTGLSASDRTGDIWLRHDQPIPAVGSYSFWFMLDNTDFASAGTNYIVYSRQDGAALSNYWFLFDYPDGSSHRLRYRCGDTASTGSLVDPFVWYHFAMTWTGSTYCAYLNGEAMTTDQSYDWDDLPTKFDFSYDSSGSNGVRIDDFILTDYVLSADQVKGIYLSNSPVQLQMSRHQLMLTDSGAGKVVGSADGLFGWDDEGTECFVLSTADAITWGNETVNSGDTVLGDPSGAHLMWDASAGQLLFRDSTPTTQVFIDTDGKVYAGSGNVRLSDDGLEIIGGYGGSTSAIQWNYSTIDGTRIGQIYSYQSTQSWLWVGAEGLSAGSPHAVMRIAATHENTSTYDADFTLYTSTIPYAALGAEYLRINAADDPRIIFDTDGTDWAIGIDDSNNDMLKFNTGSSLVDLSDFAFYSDGSNPIMFINDNANGEMEVGLTINQGQNNDGEILALKSSTDVDHGITTVTETDTFGFFRKTEGDAGGLYIGGVKDQAGVAGGAIWIDGILDEAADTNQTTSGYAVIIDRAYIGSGTGVTSVASGGNVWCVMNASTTEFIIDGSGNYYYNGADGGAFDDYDDAQLVRAFTTATSPNQAIRSKWDQFVDYNEDTLVEAGILGAPRAEGGLVNGAQLQRLYAGAIWQAYEERQQMREEIRALLAEVEDYKKLLEDKNCKN